MRKVLLLAGWLLRRQVLGQRRAAGRALHPHRQPDLFLVPGRLSSGGGGGGRRSPGAAAVPAASGAAYLGTATSQVSRSRCLRTMLWGQA